MPESSYDLQGHHPGCPFDRNRPCTCAYLRSWNPKDTEVGQEPVSVQGREAHMRIIPDGSLMFFGGHLRMTPIAAADTPQNRYARLRALVPKRTRNFEDDLARAVALDHHAHTTPHLPFRPDETGVRQIMAAASPYKKGPLTSSARKYLTEHPEVLWRQVADDWQRKAEFYKTASLIFMGSAVLSAGCLFSKIVGWW